jgi:hypothetical protein
MTVETRAWEIDAQLQRELVALVGGLSIESLITRYIEPAGEAHHWEPLSSYQLWPIVGVEAEGEPLTLDAAEYAYEIVGGPKEGHCLCVDAWTAIVLGFEGRVAAFGAAGITEEGALRIVQLQGAAENHIDRVAARGRRGGFYWPDALIEGWASIARKLGVSTLELLPGEQNSWLRPHDPERNERIIRKYTAAAVRSGFNRNLKTRQAVWMREP